MTDSRIKIFRQEAKFIAGVAKKYQFPKLFLPQIAFVGKSNVGKSSLINSICKRKSLAHVSNTPGRTQQINFFSIADKMLISDLPGYGFAKVSHTQRNDWQKLIMYYLENSSNLPLVNLLIDSRRGIKNHDIDAMDLLKTSGRTFQLILTKSDKEKVDDKYLESIRNLLNSIGHNCNIIVTSCKTGLGIKELQFSILDHI